MNLLQQKHLVKKYENGKQKQYIALHILLF